MTIINPKSIAGVTSITTASGADNLLTVHTNNTTERVRINNDGDVIVGSGITVSPDGDIFATGVCTATTFSGSGASLTNLPAANITGTLPSISGANLTGIDTDLVSDTSPQLGGNLDVNTKNITFGDSGGATDDRLTFGAGTDLSIYHDGSHTWMKNTTGRLILQTDGDQLQLRGDTVKFFDGDAGETLLQATLNGAVDLYYDNVKTFSTISNGILIEGTEGAAGILQLYADEGDDNGDKWRFVAETSGILNLQDYGAGSWYNNIRFTGNTGGVILFQNNDAKFQTQSDGVRVEDAGYLYFANDSENGSSAIRNGAGSGESNLLFTTGGGDRWQISNSGHLLPQANDSYDIGEASYRVRNIYTGDLHCSNEGSKNDVDGTWGDYTIQEGESDLFLINNRSGKKYKFNLTEVS